MPSPHKSPISFTSLYILPDLNISSQSLHNLYASPSPQSSVAISMLTAPHGVEITTTTEATLSTPSPSSNPTFYLSITTKSPLTSA